MASIRLPTAVALIWFSLVFLAGCGGSDGTPAQARDEFEIVPFASTIILKEGDLALLDEDEDGILRFSEVPPSLAGVEPGQVIVAGRSDTTPNGLLRIVKSVPDADEGFALETLHAPLQLAFRKVHIRAARRSTGELAEEPWPGSLEPLGVGSVAQPVRATRPVNVIVFDGDGDTETTNDQVAIDGELAGAIDFSFDLDFDWGALEDLPEAVGDCIDGLLEAEFSCSLLDLLPEARAELVVTPSLDAHLELEGAAMLAFEKEFTLFQTTLGVLVFGPVVVTPNVSIVAKASGAASAQFRTELDAGIAFDTSVAISSKSAGNPEFNPPELTRAGLEAGTPEVALRASARAGLGAELALMVYGVAGPFFGARAFGELEADVLREPCVTLSAGLEGSLGVKITTPAILWLDPIELFEWSVDFEPIEEEIAAPVAECEAPPNASELPPGSGPDAERLAMPTFEPWSRSWGAPLDSGTTITGGVVNWIDHERTIDNRFVVAARGAEALTKIGDDGALVWSRRFLGDEDDPNTLLSPARVISTRDAALLVLAEAALPPLGVIKLTQAGNVLFRRELEIPDPVACGPQPAGLALDGGTGFYAVVSCALAPRVYVVHLNAKGEVVGAMSFTDAAADGAEAISLAPMVVRDVGTDLFLSGRVSRPLDSMFALRFDDRGELAFASRYEACGEGPDVYPVRALVEDNGDVTVAGRGGAEHNGFLARLKPDGSVGFAAFPGFGFGAGSVFVLDSVAQLPTTGYVVSGSAVQFTADAPANVPGIALLQLDSAGRPLWARRYVLHTPSGDYAPSAQTDLHLTDDGGIVVSAAAQHEPGSTSAQLWAMKVPAKDGEIAFGGGAEAFAAPDLVALDCSLQQLDWEVALQSEHVTARPAPTHAAPLELEGDQQTD